MSLGRRLVAHPGWIGEHLRMARARSRDRGDGFSLGDQRVDDVFDDVHEALARVLERDRVDVVSRAADVWTPQPLVNDYTPWRSRLPLLTILGVSVQVLRPAAVVETGVERGFSSATTLAALAQNRRGRLYSIDLPPLGEDPATFTGSVVPEHLRKRWDLRIGPSRQLLPALLEELGAIDVFLHDADHTYASQLDEFRTIWPVLRPGGLLISDDVWNSSLAQFCTEAGATPVYLRRWGNEDGIGLVRKPAAS